MGIRKNKTVEVRESLQAQAARLAANGLDQFSRALVNLEQANSIHADIVEKSWEITSGSANYTERVIAEATANHERIVAEQNAQREVSAAAVAKNSRAIDALKAIVGE